MQDLAGPNRYIHFLANRMSSRLSYVEHIWITLTLNKASISSCHALLPKGEDWQDVMDGISVDEGELPLLVELLKLGVLLSS